MEAHKKIGRTKCKIKATGEVYDVYGVYYGKSLKDSHITLYIEKDPNNRYSLEELEKL
jgi:hypothetical protein